MTRDDIIRMAREAGFADGVAEIVGLEGFARFVALVAAAEREKVARWMIDRSYATGHGDTTEDLLKELEWQVREAEREACDKVLADIAREADSMAEADVIWICRQAIRARTMAFDSGALTSDPGPLRQRGTK